MRVRIEDVIYFIRDAQFQEKYVCLYPLDTPFFYRVDYDDTHTRDSIMKDLTEKGYLIIDWTDAVEETL